MLGRPHACFLGFALACLGVETSASAQETSASLFAEGQKLMAQGKFAEACPKFEKALSISSGVGTKFNLGDCYEKTGRPATALRLFREVEETTKQAGQTERATTAKQRADGLEPRVPTVVVQAPWLSARSNATITVDGTPIKPEDVAKPIRVDFGLHQAIARSNDNETRAQVLIERESESRRLVLEDPGRVAAPPPPPPPAAPPPTPLETEPPPVETASSGGTQRIVGVVTGGVGAVMLAVGGVVVLGAKSDYDEATMTCGTTCPREQTVAANDARSAANVGGVVFGIGGVALVTGVVLFFTAPSSRAAPASASSSAFRIVPTAGARSGGVAIGGAF